MITGKLNLAALHHVIQVGKNAKGEEIECILIPIEKNRFFKGKNGAIYLDIVGFDHKTDYSTHLVKQSFSKEEREKIGKEGMRDLPIIGNLDASNEVKEANNDANGGQPVKEGNDLPF